MPARPSPLRLLVRLAASLCGPATRGVADAQCPGNTTGLVSIPDLGTGTYQGFQGGLYPGGSNTIPAGHLADALGQAALIVPRDGDGSPDPERGLIGFVSLGISSLCHKWGTFERREDADPERNPRIVLVNCAQGGSAADKIEDPSDPYWQNLLQRVTAAGLTPAQVQVIWFEEAYEDPGPFPGHVLSLRADLVKVLQNARSFLPNLLFAYVSCRSYGGYTIPPREPESYENGFAQKMLIQDQIAGAASLNWNPARGPVLSPLLVWGPYLWADGLQANGPGGKSLFWCRCDYEDCVDDHLSRSGETKVWQLMRDQLYSDPTALSWYPRQDGPRLAWVDAEADAYVDVDFPETNFGTGEELYCNLGKKVVYARFDFSGVRRPVLHAKLNVRVDDEAIVDVQVADDDAWGETTITWNDRPPVSGPFAGQMPFITRDGTRNLDVTAIVNADADGVITFAMRNTTSFDATTFSREEGEAPRLVFVPLDRGNLYGHRTR